MIFLGNRPRWMVEGMRLAWRVLHNEHLGPYVNKIFGLTQEIVESERRLADFVRDNCGTIFHPVGTAGKRSNGRRRSVCRVHGVEGLDCASPMPR
jgi:hypothetical protein